MSKNSLEEIRPQLGDPGSVVDIDLKDLKENMVKSLAVLNASLFQQAQFNFDRLNKLNKLVGSLEEKLFSEEALKTMDPKDYMHFYSVSKSSTSQILRFMMELNKNVSHSTEAIAHLEQLEREKSAGDEEPEEVNTEAIDAVRKQIAAMIKDKSKKGRKNKS